MTPVQQVSLGLLEIMEGQAVEIMALRSVLAQEVDEIPDWREQVAKMKVVCAEKVHGIFEQLRAVLDASAQTSHLPNDLDSVVRRALDTLQSNDFWDT